MTISFGSHLEIMELVDTHCHIHDREFFSHEEALTAYQTAVEAGVKTLLLIGTSLKDSQAACRFAADHPGCYASIGVHPHEALKVENNLKSTLEELELLAKGPSVRAVGECGLDFYYNDRQAALPAQCELLEGQLEIASKHKLPVSFHVREAFDDFWPILDNFKDIKGVLHSFTDRQTNLDKALSRGLMIGVNGIATFTNHTWQRELFAGLPLESMLIETDAPFLTPQPKRGNLNRPENVIYITKFLAELRGESQETIAKVTTANAHRLFRFN